MVEGVEVVVVGNVVRDDLGVHQVALALLADLVQGLRGRSKTFSLHLLPETERMTLVGCVGTCVSLTVEVLGASGLDSEMVYMISRVWLPASSFFQG